MFDISVKVHDASIGLWFEKRANDALATKVYQGVLRLLKKEGWDISPDPSVSRVISANFRLASKGVMQCAIQKSPCVVKLEFWATSWKAVNQYGQRHDFDKMQKMPFIDRMRFKLIGLKLISWLRRFSVLAGDVDAIENPFGRLATTDQKIAEIYAKDCHADKELGRPVPANRWDMYSADGETIEHAQKVWYRDSKGRIRRGEAYFKNSTRWMIRENQSSMTYVSASEIFCRLPEDLRAKSNENLRRKRLEHVMVHAMRVMNLKKASVLRDLIFGDGLVYFIRKKGGGYYSIQYCGYANDLMNAGRYTFEEASREVRRVPHELEMVGPDGKLVDLSDMAKAA